MSRFTDSLKFIALAVVFFLLKVNGFSRPGQISKAFVFLKILPHSFIYFIIFFLPFCSFFLFHHPAWITPLWITVFLFYSLFVCVSVSLYASALSFVPI